MGGGGGGKREGRGKGSRGRGEEPIVKEGGREGVMDYFSYDVDGRSNSNYIIVDDHLITAQNSLSTLTAVQNLILLSNAR